MVDRKRGQAGIEYVILIGILLVFLIPTIYYSLNEANNNVKLTQLESSVRRLVKAADSVHAIGPGAIEIITVTLPSGIQKVNISGTEILLEVSMFGGVSDVHFPSKVQLVGNLPTKEGSYNIRVESQRSGKVNITQRQ